MGSRNKLSRPAAGARDQWRVRAVPGQWSVVSGQWSVIAGCQPTWILETRRNPHAGSRRLGSWPKRSGDAGQRVDGKKIRRLHMGWAILDEDPILDGAMYP
jgi:hypothetical protein